MCMFSYPQISFVRTVDLRNAHVGSCQESCDEPVKGSPKPVVVVMSVLCLAKLKFESFPSTLLVTYFGKLYVLT